MPRTISPALAMLAALGCGVTTSPTETRQGTDTPPGTNPTTPTPTTTNTTPKGTQSACPDGLAALRDLDIPLAVSEYDACVAADPNSTEARFGRGLSTMLDISEWAETNTMMGWCGETGGNDLFFGDAGLFRMWASGDDGDAALTFEALEGPGATPTPFDLTRVRPRVLTEIDDRWFTMAIENPFGEGGRLRLNTMLDDAYQDGTNVPMTTGTVLDADRLRLNFDPPCDAPYSRCVGYGFSTTPRSGTVTIDQMNDEAGEEVVLTFAVDMPGYCASKPCTAIHRIRGTVRDDILRLPEEADLPFSDFDEDAACGFEPYCGAFPAMNVVAEACDLPSFGAVHDELGGMAASFIAIAEDFEVAGSAAGATFLMPHEANPFAREDMALNQADALAFGASARAAAFALETAENYEAAGESETPESLVQRTTFPQYDRKTDMCVDEPGYGMTTDDMVSMLDDHTGYLRAGADLTEMENAFADLLTDLRAVLSADPTEQGVLHPAAPGAATYLGAIDLDLAALQTSLATPTAPVSLPSAPGFEARFGMYFANPVDQATMLADLELASMGERYGTCNDGYELYRGVGEWLAWGPHMWQVSQSFIDGDDKDYPSLFDFDLYKTAKSKDGAPVWLDPDTLDDLGVE